MFVGLTFWSLYGIDRELVLPKVLDKYFPPVLNHVMHTNIMIFIVIEMLTSCRKYPVRSTGTLILIIFMSLYLIWIHVIHACINIWVYPVLDELNLPLRIMFFACMYGFVISLYLIGEKLNSIIWDETIRKSLRCHCHCY